MEYCQADLFTSYIMYNPDNVCWDILNSTLSQYYPHILHIFGLKGVIHHLWVVLLKYLAIAIHSHFITMCFCCRILQLPKTLWSEPNILWHEQKMELLHLSCMFSKYFGLSEA